MNIKKILASLLAFVLTAVMGAAAFGQEEKAIEIYGEVAPKQTLSLFAPAGGMLEDNNLSLGDRVEEGQVLFTLATQKTFSPWDGTVRGLHLEIGQNITSVTERYGACLYIEPSQPFTVQSTTAQAYNEKENKVVLPGQEVYLLSTNDKNRMGVGLVTATEGADFTVEVKEEGNSLDVNERVGIYRKDDHDSKSRLGYGIVVPTNLVPLEGSGVLVGVHVKEGQKVQKGDLLFETLAPGTNHQSPDTNEITSPLTGIITSLAAAPGSLVSADQLLATIVDESQLQIVASVGENDYNQVRVSSPVTITFDAYPNLKPIHGTVAALAGASATETGEKEYQVKIDFTYEEPLPLGLEAKVALQP